MLAIQTYGRTGAAFHFAVFTENPCTAAAYAAAVAESIHAQVAGTLTNVALGVKAFVTSVALGTEDGVIALIAIFAALAANYGETARARFAFFARVTAGAI